MNSYKVNYNNKTVGKAYVDIQGLYAQISVSCQSLEEDFYRLFVRCGGNCLDLGVLLPNNNAMGICTKIPTKNVDLQEPIFEIVNKSLTKQELRIAVDPTVPFEHLYHITDLRLERNNTNDSMWLRLII